MISMDNFLQVRPDQSEQVATTLTLRNEVQYIILVGPSHI